MISQLLKTMSRSSAIHAGFAAALVCALGAAEADARQEMRFAASGQKLEDLGAPITKRPLSEDIVLAQHADDCGCDDADDFFEDFDEGFEEGFSEGYADDFDEDFDEVHDEGYSDEYRAETANNQGLSAEQEERLNRITGRVLGVRERAIDVQVQGSYDYYGPAQ